MKAFFTCVFLLLPLFVHAYDPSVLTFKERMRQVPIIMSDAQHPYRAANMVYYQAIKACPQGFEKLREYSFPDGDDWYIAFDVRCMKQSVSHVTPATP